MTSSPPPQNPQQDLVGVIATVVLVSGIPVAVAWYYLGWLVAFGLAIAAAQLTLLVLIWLALRDLVSEVRLQRINSRTGRPTDAGRADL